MTPDTLEDEIPLPSLMASSDAEYVMEEIEPQKKRRATRLDVMLDRQATGSVKAFSDRLGDWQEQAIRLQAILRYSKSVDDKVSARRLLCALQRDLQSVRAQLERAASALSDRVVSHSRFQDSVRSVERLESMVAGLANDADADAVAAERIRNLSP